MGQCLTSTKLKCVEMKWVMIEWAHTIGLFSTRTHRYRYVCGEEALTEHPYDPFQDDVTSNPIFDPTLHPRDDSIYVLEDCDRGSPSRLTRYSTHEDLTDVY